MYNICSESLGLLNMCFSHHLLQEQQAVRNMHLCPNFTWNLSRVLVCVRRFATLVQSGVSVAGHPSVTLMWHASDALCARSLGD
jgi:hypothetical protein